MTVSISECMEIARGELSIAKRLLDQEISAYPPPYSVCDEQYNHLLAERRRVVRLLREFDAEIHIPTPRNP